MKEICDRKKCTGCGACANICPKECITMENNEFGEIFPVIDNSKCINCKLCKENCPSINFINLNYPIKAYAMWSSDETVYNNSASGGIATELYRYALKKNWYIVGTQLMNDFSVKFNVSNNDKYLSTYKNSKYTFSNMEYTPKYICKLLKDNNTVLFIGTGCQVAAIKQCTKNIKSGKLYLVDIVCHGMPPANYLQEHIKDIQKKKRIQVDTCTFRNPQYGTDKFIFSLFNRKGETVYSKKPRSTDVYQLGYHFALIYRENCYNCFYACPERSGDLTLSDYKAIGSKAPCDFEYGKISSVLVNTECGNELIKGIIDENRVIYHQRPIEEPIYGDAQLRHPSIPHQKRDYFLLQYKKGIGFEKAAKKALRKERLVYASHYRETKQWLKQRIKALLP
ncbi:MAG: 4Fe-4S binding protein [Clostridiales bacterium]|nr:4Fe-4S binding protein [Clostridiales bacterium]